MLPFTPLSACFKRYTGDDSYDESVRYVKARFKKTFRASTRDGLDGSSEVLFIHATTATSGSSIKKAFTDTVVTVFRSFFDEFGLE